ARREGAAHRGRAGRVARGADSRSRAAVHYRGRIGGVRRFVSAGAGARRMTGRPEPGGRFVRIAPGVGLGRDLRGPGSVNPYGCEIGDETSIGTFVEIQKGVKVGARCKIQSHTFICEGVTIEDEVFIGHNVNFLNDRYPAATTGDGRPKS